MVYGDDDQRLVAQTVREFVDREVIPVASGMEHRDEYPDAMVETMKHSACLVSMCPRSTAATRSTTRPSRSSSRNWRGAGWGWPESSARISCCDVLARYGTRDQKQRFLPRLAKGDPRGGICLSEPNAGTDLQAITTTARRDGDVYCIDGSKMWVTNGRRAQVLLVLAKTDPVGPAAPSGNAAPS